MTEHKHNVFLAMKEELGYTLNVKNCGNCKFLVEDLVDDKFSSGDSCGRNQDAMFNVRKTAICNMHAHKLTVTSTDEDEELQASIQKYPKGTRVKIDEILGYHMAHFPSNKEATVLYTYAEKFGGGYTKLYCLDVDNHGQVAWYNERDLREILNAETV